MLKALLQQLLSKFVKRTDTEFMTSQAMPKGWDDRIVIYKGIESKNGDYTAPCSGYLCIDGGSKINYIELGNGPRTRIPSATSDLSLGWPQIYQPVKKGDACHYRVEVRSGITEDSTIYFIPAVGGQTT